MEVKVKRREWVKTAAIVLLAVLLVLTFFSNTIMNRSLPEVAAQYVEAGPINAKIRCSGTVSANEVYEVTLTQTRKVKSVLVKVGQQVETGDPLFVLESDDSDELKSARETLEQLQFNYEKSLLENSNAAASEDRQIQKLREAYQKALDEYRLYSYADPSEAEYMLQAAQQELSALQQEQQELENELSRMNADRDYVEAKSELSRLESAVEAAEASYADACEALDEVARLEEDIARLEQEIASENHTSVDQVYEDHEVFLSLAGNDARLCAVNLDYFMTVLSAAGETYTREAAQRLQNAYNSIDYILTLQAELPSAAQRQRLDRACQTAEDELVQAERDLKQVRQTVTYYEEDIAAVEDRLADYQDDISRQQAEINDYQAAASAAASVESAKEALEDALFQQSLSGSDSLDMQAAAREIEKQKELVNELTAEADGKEVTARVSGTVSSIQVSAGNTVGAEQTMAEITVADRGYMLSVSVTNDQARQVRIGDTAQVTNYYWGNITATLENILNDPQSMGQGKKLMFRITGDGVESGTNLTLSIGQKSANYDCLVPNSAIRTDSNGTFVLVVTSKSSPLGNRYQASRVEVEVLASDDTTSAVSGLSNGDFVITTSTKPLEAGDMVRLPDNQ